MQGTVWRSNWFPAKNLNLATQQSGSARLPPRSSSMKFSDTDYRHYVNRFMPGFNEAAYQFNNGYPQQPPPGYYQQRPPYYNGNGYQNGGRPPWGNGYNGRPPYPPVNSFCYRWLPLSARSLFLVRRSEDISRGRGNLQPDVLLLLVQVEAARWRPLH